MSNSTKRGKNEYATKSSYILPLIGVVKKIVNRQNNVKQITLSGSPEVGSNIGTTHIGTDDSK